MYVYHITGAGLLATTCNSDPSAVRIATEAQRSQGSDLPSDSSSATGTETMAMASAHMVAQGRPQPLPPLATPCQHSHHIAPGRLRLDSAFLPSPSLPAKSQVTAAKGRRALGVTVMTLAPSKEAPSQTLPPPPPNRLHEVYTKVTWGESKIRLQGQCPFLCFCFLSWSSKAPPCWELNSGALQTGLLTGYSAIDHAENFVSLYLLLSCHCTRPFPVPVQMGQSPWIDNLTRDWASSGHLEELLRRGVRGLTSNPTV